MLLTVDLGNTSIKSGLFEGSSLRAVARSPSRRELSAAEVCDHWRTWLSSEAVAPSEVSAAIVCSVVPALTPVIADGLRLLIGAEPSIVGPDTDSGVTLAGPDPREVGADRVANAAGAWASLRARGLQPGEAPGQLVVDLGTATKLDVVSPAGELLGGVIAPGVETSLEGLVARAAKLRAVPLQAPERVLGRSTVACVQSGVLHGHASLIDGLVARLRRELGFDCEVLATGGYAPLIAPLTESLRRIEPALTLLGLCAIHTAIHHTAIHHTAIHARSRAPRD